MALNVTGEFGVIGSERGRHVLVVTGHGWTVVEREELLHGLPKGLFVGTMRDRRGWITSRFAAVGHPGEGHRMRFRHGTCLVGQVYARRILRERYLRRRVEVGLRELIGVVRTVRLRGDRTGFYVRSIGGEIVLVLEAKRMDARGKAYFASNVHVL